MAKGERKLNYSNSRRCLLLMQKPILGRMCYSLDKAVCVTLVNSYLTAIPSGF